MNFQQGLVCRRVAVSVWIGVYVYSYTRLFIAQIQFKIVSYIHKNFCEHVAKLFSVLLADIIQGNILLTDDDTERASLPEIVTPPPILPSEV